MKYSPIKICLYICATLLVMYVMTFRSKYRYLENGKVEEGIYIKKWFFKYPKTVTFFLEKKQDFNKISTIENKGFKKHAFHSSKQQTFAIKKKAKI